MCHVNRVKDPLSCFHIWNRGNNRQNIFVDDYDKQAFIDRLSHYLKKFDIILLAYCIMTNHFHIVIDANGADISEFMKGLTLSYGSYFRRKYGYCGYLMQDRFGSRLIDSDISLLSETNYTHKNPMEAGICAHPQDYKWSSFRCYMGYDDPYGIVKPDKVLSILSRNKASAVKAYAKVIELSDCCDVNDFMEDYTYENYEKYNVKRDHNPSHVAELISHREGLCKDKICMKYSHQYTSLKQICMYLLNLKCNMSHNAIGLFFNTTGSNVGKSIRNIIDKLGHNEKLQSYFDTLCSCIA